MVISLVRAYIGVPHMNSEDRDMQGAPRMVSHIATETKWQTQILEPWPSTQQLHSTTYLYWLMHHTAVTQLEDLVLRLWPKAWVLAWFQFVLSSV